MRRATPLLAALAATLLWCSAAVASAADNPPPPEADEAYWEARERGSRPDRESPPPPEQPSPAAVDEAPPPADPVTSVPRDEPVGSVPRERPSRPVGGGDHLRSAAERAAETGLEDREIDVGRTRTRERREEDLTSRIRSIGRTQERPPTITEQVEQPPTYTPGPPPPTLFGEELDPQLCCGLQGEVLAFPNVRDPWPIADKPVAPWAPAVGAFQVLIDRGAFFMNELDLSVPVTPFPIEWKRHYLSDAKVQDGGLVGHNWDFSYNKRIVPIGRPLANGLMVQLIGVEKSRLVFHDGQGRGEFYSERHSERRLVQNFDQTFRAYVTTYGSPPGQFHEIERYVLLDGEHPFGEHVNVEKSERIFYVLREKNGARYVFNCRGQLIYVLSRHHTRRSPVRVELRYQGPLNPLTNNRTLSLIIDARLRQYGVKTTFIGKSQVFTNLDCKLVTGVLPIPRIKSISGGGYSVEYRYKGGDSQPILESVRVSTGDVTREWRYAYDGEHRMTEAWSPRGAAAGAGGRPMVVNTYAGGKVTAQALGPISYRVGYGAAVTVATGGRTTVEHQLSGKGPYAVIAATTVRGPGGAWTTRYEHNSATQVVRITRPRGDATVYAYDESNGPITEGPFLDWSDRGWVYENDLSAGNVLQVTQLPVPGSGEKPLQTRSTYEPLYNQLKTSVGPRGAETSYEYRFHDPAERGEPVAENFPSFKQAEGGEVRRPQATYGYNRFGQRITEDAGGNRVTRYTYNDRTGELERIDHPGQGFRAYVRGPRGEVLRETGPEGTVQYTRDGLGRITTKVVDPGGADVRSTFTYDPDGNVLTATTEVKDVFDPALLPGTGLTAGPSVTRTTRTTYDPLNRPLEERVEAGALSSTTTYVYGPDGELASKTAAGLTTRYGYDARGLPTSIVEGAGTPQALTTAITYDANGNETRVERSGGGASHARTKTYDGHNRLKTETSALGAVTTYAYEPGGEIVSVETRGSAGPAQGERVLQRTSYEYTLYGDLMRRRRDTLVNGSEETVWFYDPDLRVNRIRAPNGAEMTFEHDDDGRVVKSVDPMGDETVTSYNNRGQAWRVTHSVQELSYAPSTGRYASRRRAYVTTYSFDRLGAMVRAEGSGAPGERRFYNSAGQLRAIFLPGEGLTVYTYDPLGRRTGLRNGEQFETTAYSPAGLVSESATPTVHKSFEYDALGRNTAITDRLSGARTRITYDGLGREIERTDANGTVVRKTLNAEGLPTRVDVTLAQVGVQVGDKTVPGLGGVQQELYDYDALGRAVKARTSQSSELRFAYDGLDRVIDETQAFRSYGQTLRRRYAADQTWREVDYPEIAGRPTVRWEYDELGRVQSVSAGGEMLSAYEYSGPERVARQALGNGVEARYAYDEALRLSSLTIAGRTGAPIWSATPEYPGGRLNRLTERLAEPAGGVPPKTLVTERTRDRTGRVTASVTESFTMPKTPGDVADEVSGSLSVFERGRLARSVEYVRDGESYELRNFKVDSFAYASGRVASVTTAGTANADLKDSLETAEDAARAIGRASGMVSQTQRFQYDNLGNVLYDGRFIYTYDYESRLIRVEDTWAPYRYDESVAFYYDAMGRRIYIAPNRDRAPVGMVAWGGAWEKADQWHLYDEGHVVAETWVHHRKAARPVTLLARYFFGQPDERLRMDRKPEDDPAQRPITYYLHQGAEGELKLFTNAGGQPTFARNLDPGPGGGAAGRPPGDEMVLALSSVRMPYSSALTRLDSFAGLTFAADGAEPLFSYRTAHAWAREVDAQAFRDSAAALQNRLNALMAGAIAVPLTAGAAAAYVGPAAFYSSVLVGGTLNLGMNAYAAWTTQSGYSLEEGVGNFALGAINGMTGAVVSQAARTVVQELVLNYAVNAMTDTYTGAVFEGQAWRDAAAQGLVSGAVGAGMGFAAGRVHLAALSVAESAAARANTWRGAVRVEGQQFAAAPAKPFQGDYVDAVSNNKTRVRDLYFADEVRPTGKAVKNFENQVLAELLNGTEVSRQLGLKLVAGELQIRGSRFDTSSYAVWHAETPKNLHVNIGQTYVDGRTGVKFNVMDSPLMFAALVVHEGLHALGGDELVAHTGQAKFLAVRGAAFKDDVRIGRAAASDRPLLDYGHLRLMAQGQRNAMGDILADIIQLRDYKIRRIVWARNVDPWVRGKGGWGEVLEVDPHRFSALRQRAADVVKRYRNGPDPY